MTIDRSSSTSLRCRQHVLDTTPRRLGALEPVPNDEREDREALWRRLRRDGYLYLRGEIDVEAVLNFRRFYLGKLAHTGLLRAESKVEDGIGEHDGVNAAEVRRVLFDEIVPSAEYEALCRHGDVQGFFAWLYDADVHLHKRKLIRHARVHESWTTPAHYDLVYLREGTRNLLSAWIPLGDCPVARGGLVYLEGSHVWCEAFDHTATRKMIAQAITFDLPALADEHDARWLAANYRAGDMVVHSPFIVHASLDNVDEQGRMRLSTDIRFQRASDLIEHRWQGHWRDDDGL